MGDTTRLPSIFVPTQQADEAAEYLRRRAMEFKCGIDQPTPVERLAYHILLKAGYFPEEKSDD